MAAKKKASKKKRAAARRLDQGGERKQGRRLPWEAWEAEFVASQVSMAEFARQKGVCHTHVQKRGRERRWIEKREEHWRESLSLARERHGAEIASAMRATLEEVLAELRSAMRATLTRYREDLEGKGEPPPAETVVERIEYVDDEGKRIAPADAKKRSDARLQKITMRRRRSSPDSRLGTSIIREVSAILRSVVEMERDAGDGGEVEIV